MHLAVDGFPPPKVPVPTVQKKAQAVAQNKATRAARHTMGKKRKAQIKGVVPSEATPPAASSRP
jgi:hypothetical protein